MPNASSDVAPHETAATPAVRPVPQVPPPQAGTVSAEIGGPQGPEPTRYGDWERKGRCIDF